MRITREAISAVSRAASKARTTPVRVAGVLITAEKIEATNGYVLLRHTIPVEQRGGFDASKIAALDSITTALKSKVVRRDGLIVAIGTEKEARPRYSSDGGPCTMEVVDLKFPDTSEIIPTDEQIGFRVTLAPGVLQAIASAASDLGDEYPSVTLEFTRMAARRCCCTDASKLSGSVCHCNDDNMGGLSTLNAVRVTMAANIPDKKIVGAVMPMSL